MLKVSLGQCAAGPAVHPAYEASLTLWVSEEYGHDLSKKS